jgi:hypothetical protein
MWMPDWADLLIGMSRVVEASFQFGGVGTLHIRGLMLRRDVLYHALSTDDICNDERNAVRS